MLLDDSRIPVGRSNGKRLVTLSACGMFSLNENLLSIFNRKLKVGVNVLLCVVRAYTLLVCSIQS